MAQDEKTRFLLAATDALEREVTRLSKLVHSGSSGPFKGKHEIITSKFSTQVTSFKSDYIKKIRDDIQAGNLQQAWENYVELKTVLIPMVTRDLLSVLGGLYAREVGLDNLNPDPEEKNEDHSFSFWAENLVGDLKSRSNWIWSSVLIVGEERFIQSETDIIRLRFPACDLWNLPFSAHEYGYLIAFRQPPKGFARLRDRITNLFSQAWPDYTLEDERCLLPEVAQEWNKLRLLGSETERTAYLQANKAELDRLVNRQLTHLGRLFADAFATFFLGPAYVHTLLQLGFVPGESLYASRTELPAFAQRFVFALETLSWINRQPLIETEKHPFDTEIEVWTEKEKEIRRGSLPTHWSAALQSAGKEDRYDEIQKTFKPWLDEIQNAFNETEQYRALNAIGRTYLYWKIAKQIYSSLVAEDLTAIILSDREAQDARDKILPILLNAAWLARFNTPGRDEMEIRPIIEENVRRVLYGEVKIEEKARERQGTEYRNPNVSGMSAGVQDDYIKQILKGLVLAGQDELKDRFEQLVNQGEMRLASQQLGNDILGAIYDNREALKAYRYFEQQVK